MCKCEQLRELWADKESAAVGESNRRLSKQLRRRSVQLSSFLIKQKQQCRQQQRCCQQTTMRCSSGQRSDHGVKVDASANIAKFNSENNCSCVNNESSFRPSINNNHSNSNNDNNVCCPTVEGEGEVRSELQQQQPEANEIESGATSAATATLTLTATAADKCCDCVAQRQTTTTTVKTMRAGASNLNALLRKTARDCNDDVACAAIDAAAAVPEHFR